MNTTTRRTVKIAPATTQLVATSNTSTVTAGVNEGHTIRSIAAASGLDYNAKGVKMAVGGLVKYLLLTGAITKVGRRHNIVKGKSLRGRPEDVYTFGTLSILTQFATLAVPEAVKSTTVAKKITRKRTTKTA
jgi:hypothetical protein